MKVGVPEVNRRGIGGTVVSEGKFICRPGCGACCIAPSISSLNKPASVPCLHLTGEFRCAIFGRPERPACCAGLQASAEMCGRNRDEALVWLARLEALTA